MQSDRKYINEDVAKKIAPIIKAYFHAITSDEKFERYSKYWSQERWQFFDGYYEKHARNKINEIFENLVKSHSEIKKSIYEGEIIEFIKNRIFDDLTFGVLRLLIQTNVEKEEKGKVKITLEPREISLKSALSDSKELEAIYNVIEDKILGLVNFYKEHKSLSYIPIANVEIEENLIWSFGYVDFISKTNLAEKENYIKWVGSIFKQGPIPADHNIGVIKFEGCSAYKSLTISLKHFSRVFNCLKALSEICLNKQHWTSREYLEIPDQSIGIISSHDNPMWSAIEPDLDNDFYAALKGNSIYKPVVLNKGNVDVINKFKYINEVNILLDRSIKENISEIDEKIFNALSWFSESQKIFIAAHKYVGFVTALETLLTNKSLLGGDTSDKGLGEMLSERGAILLESTYEKRLEIKKELKRIYGIRSKIVHGSNRKIYESDQYDLMDSKNFSEIFKVQKITADIIMAVINIIEKEKITSMAQLNEYFQKTLLS